jgi:hypothetical protein
MFRHIVMLILVLSLVADGATTLPRTFFDIQKPTALMPCGIVVHTVNVEAIETAVHSVDEIY